MWKSSMSGLKEQDSGDLENRLPVTVYTPLNRGAEYNLGWLSLFRRTYANRELLGRLMYRDFTTRYRQSLLGYFWAIFMPFVAVAIFAFIARYRVLPMGQVNMPYIVFGVWSFTVWQLFSNSLSACTSSLSAAGPMLSKINFSKDTLVIASLMQPILDFLLRLVFLAGLFWYFEFMPSIESVWIPLLLIPLILMALGIGLMLSILNLLVRDIGNFVGMFAIFGMFFAPVLYPPPVTWPFMLVNIINPVSPILIATQDLLSTGELSHPGLLLGSLVFSFAVLLVGWRLFHLLIPRVIERA